MKYDNIDEVVVKTIRLNKDLIEEINSMAKEAERDFSSQVRYMLKEYIAMKKLLNK